MKNKKKAGKAGKNIKRFLSSEEGKMLDSDIVRAGIALGILGTVAVDQASAQIHTNYLHTTGHASHNSHGSHASHGSHGSHASHGSHGSHSSHGSHGSHGSHARGGWC